LTRTYFVRFFGLEATKSRKISLCAIFLQKFAGFSHGLVGERTREFGVRMAVGACLRDLVLQMLVETVALALAGGLIGSLFGVAASLAVAGQAGWRVSIAPLSVLVAWGLAGAVGLLFGLYPAYRASQPRPNIERARQLLAAAESAPQRRRAEADSEAENILPTRRCPCCGGRMIIVETFEGPRPAQSPLPSRIGIDTS
jgi:hypothetical protein